MILNQVAIGEGSGAVLKARINPNGASTTYHFEYGVTSSYGQSTPDEVIAAGTEPFWVAQQAEGLEPNTTYHYRVVAANGIQQAVGEDGTFTTDGVSDTCPNAPVRAAQGATYLWDCRAYEQVSPREKLGQNLYFDTGSDRVRPESTPTLKEIATMLTEHPELKLTIEGHTDNVGAAAANQTLSEKRAAAVKQALVSQFAVDGGRLESKGLGATAPSGTNDTPEGRQANRRVELVKS
jgi:outer membrane protein OmpA-like peptidoglycan-associated protein